MLRKYFYFGLAILLCGNLLAEKPHIDPGIYYAGGAIGTLFGFGIGHAIQGRYHEMGWVFTMTEAGSLALILGGALVAVSGKVGPRITIGAGALLSFTGWASFTGFRIWEVVDSWTGARPMEAPMGPYSVQKHDLGNRNSSSADFSDTAIALDLISVRF